MELTRRELLKGMATLTGLSILPTIELPTAAAKVLTEAEAPSFDLPAEAIAILNGTSLKVVQFHISIQRDVEDVYLSKYIVETRGFSWEAELYSEDFLEVQTPYEVKHFELVFPHDSVQHILHGSAILRDYYVDRNVFCYLLSGTDFLKWSV